jgi:uncharacterized protein (DUF924 family)
VSGAGPGLQRSQDVLEFWFGTDPMADLQGRLPFWFGNKHEPTSRRDQRDSDLRLALILLLDQFPRQVYRGQGQAFAQDAKALSLTLDGLHGGADAALAPIERVFFYMPMQHAESLDVQEESVAAFRRLLAEVPPLQYKLFDGILQFALQHQSVIQHFGRFPQRNAALDRRSSAAELAYLRSGK